ncbi:unnamed protein product [Staurois parvus]|uniref:Uncharacterized protein n=1 Tax=Staurois parvus TaxID=386267 RepID=A0ABN9GQW6_9NEOB|nr:unnamed protein product [Staurois parvus]
MQQSASTSAALPFGKLVSTSGLVYPVLSHTSTSVSLGDVASPTSTVQATAVASTSIVLQPSRIRTQAHRAPMSFRMCLQTLISSPQILQQPYFPHSLPKPEFRWKQQF